MPNDPFVDIAALSSLGPVRYLDARDQAAFDAGPRARCGARADRGMGCSGQGGRHRLRKDRLLGRCSRGARHRSCRDRRGLRQRPHDRCRAGLVHPAVLRHQGRHPERRLARTVLGDRTATGLPDHRRQDFRATPGQAPLVWSIARPSSVNSTATRMCSTRARARSSPARTRAIVRAAAICRVHGICRMSICWTTASFVRRRCCAPCWSGWDSARAITS